MRLSLKHYFNPIWYIHLLVSILFIHKCNQEVSILLALGWIILSPLMSLYNTVIWWRGRRGITNPKYLTYRAPLLHIKLFSTSLGFTPLYQNQLTLAQVHGHYFKWSSHIILFSREARKKIWKKGEARERESKEELTSLGTLEWSVRHAENRLADGWEREMKRIR